MKNIRKLALSLTLCLALLYSCLLPCAAADPSSVMPLWDNINSIEYDIVFDGSQGIAGITMTKQSGVTRMEGTLTVYAIIDGEREYVDSVYDSTTRSLVLDVYFTAESGVAYEAEFVGTAYRDSVGETVTRVFNEICP